MSNTDNAYGSNGEFAAKQRAFPEVHSITDERETTEPIADKAEEIANVQKQKGAAQIGKLAASVHRAADEIGKESPEISRFVHKGADQLNRASRSLQENSIADLFRLADRTARERPVAFIAGSVAVGFALSRFLRASKRVSGPAE